MGFVCVLDERTLAILERPGNKRCDTIVNVLQNPEVGLISLVSAAVREATIGSAFRFEALEPVELKGVPGVWTLYRYESAATASGPSKSGGG